MSRSFFVENSLRRPLAKLRRTRRQAKSRVNRYEMLEGRTLLSENVSAVHSYNDLHDAKLYVDAAHGLLAGAASPQGPALAANVLVQPQHGSLTLDSNGAFRFTPQHGYIGDDSFVYQASDGHGYQSGGLARISIVAQWPASSASTTPSGAAAPLAGPSGETITVSQGTVDEGASITVAISISNAPGGSDTVIVSDGGDQNGDPSSDYKPFSQTMTVYGSTPVTIGIKTLDDLIDMTEGGVDNVLVNVGSVNVNNPAFGQGVQGIKEGPPDQSVV